MEIEDIKREVKAGVDTMMAAVQELKDKNDQRLTEIEKKGAADPLLTDQIKKINATLDLYEPLNQKITLAEQKAKAVEDQLGAQNAIIAKMEAKLGRPGAHSGQERAIELKKKVNDWGRAVISANAMGVANLSEDQRKALADVAAEYKVMRISDDTTGGYLAPIEFVQEIIKAETLISPVRGLVKVRPTSNKSVQVPKRTGQFAAVWVSEQGTRAETTGLTYGREEVPTHELYALIDISNEDLEDSAFDMEAELKGEASEQFAVAEGAAVVSGATPGKPEGFMTNADVASVVSGSASAITVGTGTTGLMGVFYTLKTAYAANATWVMNRQTLGSVRGLKDGNSNYIWVPGLAQGQPNTILGAPYAELPDMPAEGSNTYPVAVGDFRRAYTLVDRISMQFLRDPFTQATSGNIRMIFRRRLGGQVVLAEAIKKLKCST